MASTEGHYTAVVEILHSTPKKVPTGSFRGGVAEETDSGERIKRDVARIVVRSDSIEELTTQVQAHLALVKDYR